MWRNRIKLIKNVIGFIVFTIFTVFLVTLNTHPKPLSEAGKFIAKNEAAIKEEIWEKLDPEKKHIHSITIQSSTARGLYENGLGVSYHIHFQAFANNDENYIINGNIGFPNAEFGPFTFKKPDLYKNEEMYLSDWYVEAERTDASQWKWKMDEEEREYEEEKRQHELLWKKREELTNQKEPYIKDWIRIHEASLKKVIYDIVLQEEPKVAQALGEIESVELNHLFYITEGSHGCSVILDLRFENFPEEKAIFRTSISFDDFSFQDLTKGGKIDFDSDYFEIELSGRKSQETVETSEIIIREVDNQEFRVD